MVCVSYDVIVKIVANISELKRYRKIHPSKTYWKHKVPYFYEEGKPSIRLLRGISFASLAASFGVYNLISLLDSSFSM
jgi:hypothetical protein